jgi:hypothetical protein
VPGLRNRPREPLPVIGRPVLRRNPELRRHRIAAVAGAVRGNVGSATAPALPRHGAAGRSLVEKPARLSCGRALRASVLACAGPAIGGRVPVGRYQPAYSHGEMAAMPDGMLTPEETDDSARDAIALLRACNQGDPAAVWAILDNARLAVVARMLVPLALGFMEMKARADGFTGDEHQLREFIDEQLQQSTGLLLAMAPENLSQLDGPDH